MKLWDKGGKGVDAQVEAFTVGDDYVLDKKLVKFDALASIAHAKVLVNAGFLSKLEAEKLEACMKEIIALAEKGKFKILPEDEDCHTAIEKFLVKTLGETGKKIHALRSRNDQVLAALRLYSKGESQEIANALKKLVAELKAFAKKNAGVKMPGYTHLQKAMPSSVSLWANAFADALQDDLALLEFSQKLVDQNPLGSAAGYGVPVAIDRKLSTKLLGFSKLQENPLYCANSRGKFEAIVLSACVQAMLDLNKLAMDLQLFSMPEFGYFELPEELCTGSSIMPQKKNPDVLELVRAKSHVVQGELFKVLGIVSNLPSGYNRDFQLTKEPLMNGLETTKASLQVMALAVSKLKVDKWKCESALTAELFATENALKKAKAGMPFREAYKAAAKELLEGKGKAKGG